MGKCLRENRNRKTSEVESEKGQVSERRGERDTVRETREPISVLGGPRSAAGARFGPGGTIWLSTCWRSKWRARPGSSPKVVAESARCYGIWVCGSWDP